jgi:hypothetical protein
MLALERDADAAMMGPLSDADKPESDADAAEGRRPNIACGWQRSRMQKMTPSGYGRTYGSGILTCVTDGRGAEQAYELAGPLKRACLAAMFALAEGPQRIAGVFEIDRRFTAGPRMTMIRDSGA